MSNPFISLYHYVLKLKELSTYECLSLLISLIGLISLFLLICQIRIANEQTENMTLQTRNMIVQTDQLSATLENTALTNISNRELEINKMLFDHPELKPYFFSGKPVNKSDKNYEAVTSLASMRLDFVGTVWDQTLYMQEFRNEQNPAWQAWKRYIFDIFSTSPAMCQCLEESRRWYTEEFLSFARSGCAVKNHN